MVIYLACWPDVSPYHLAWRTFMSSGSCHTHAGYAQIHAPEYTKAITCSKVELVKSQMVSFGPDYVTIQNGKRIAADVVVRRREGRGGE